MGGGEGRLLGVTTAQMEDFNTFHDIMLDIRDKFSDIIKNYDFAIALKEEKLDYYPGCYPKFD